MKYRTKLMAVLCKVVWTGWMLAGLLLAPSGALSQDAAHEFFEREVRPILVEECSRCHGSKEQSGGLRVDQRQALLRGGDTAPAVVPGDASQSLLLQAVRRSADLAMPPDKNLSEHAIGVLERWIELGAPWPESSRAFGTAVDAQQHWAFQPLQPTTIPAVEQSNDPSTAIDAFVIKQLADHALSQSPEADRRTLIRRVTYTLTGLPPRPDEVEQFVHDDAPSAYPRLVERLLASPQYGEHWARHWLDVARYSDTKGYVYAREERYWVHAWAYRDWVTQALNQDMPYDRFLLLQLAADQVEDREQGDLAAMGFLTLGRRFLGVRRDIIDDRIDVVCRSTMGLTVSCARCHDHKYDPIASADYYSLYGVFDSCFEDLVPLEKSSDPAFEEELHKRQTTLETKLAAQCEESSERARSRVVDYLASQTELHKYPADGFDQVFEKSDLLPAFVRRWERYLREAGRRHDPVFVAWQAYAELPQEDFAAGAHEVTQRLQALPADQLNRRVAKAFEQPPATFQEVCQRYGTLLLEVKQQWEATRDAANELGKPPASQLDDPEAEALRLVLYGEQSPCQVPSGSIANSEMNFDLSTCTELWKLQGEVDRWIINSSGQAPHALTLVDQATPTEPRIFLRGNPLTQGRDVPRQFLLLLAGPDRKPFQIGSGRYELAQAIIQPDNPLTARVIVNRVWAGHFGQGLVATTSDFGIRAEPPSHPELLDWLSAKFISEGWSLKELHRWILLSKTFRQSSVGPDDAEERRTAMRVDPANRWLWRENSRRLSFEEFRDSLLATATDLDYQVGGKPTELFAKPYPKRRTLYGLVDRQYLPGTLRMFDFANPDLHVAQRNETTVPQQSLFLMNHPLVLERVQALSKLVHRPHHPRESVAALFQQVLQRTPSEMEMTDALEFVSAATPAVSAPPAARPAEWQYGYGAYDPDSQRTTGFKPLPLFTGSAWQGGGKWPDEKLGWVQLTAEGGHPGNDREHAAIRRWTAPQDMTVRVQSKLQHDPAQGDGIRAFIISSQHGLQQSLTIHHDSAELNVESLTVTQGDTLDFLVDIGNVLNSDQYLWQVSIQALDSADPNHWNSFEDFPRDIVHVLDAWEQLAQVLLCSNEFMYVD